MVGGWHVTWFGLVLQYKWKYVEQYKPQYPPLPSDRVNLDDDGQVFKKIGIDYFGPLRLANGSKCYGFIATCFICRAIHIELVKDKTVKSLLKAICLDEVYQF